MKNQPQNSADQNADKKTHNNHLAMRKFKDAQHHIDIMNKRFQVLKVKDDEYRSMTIQHQNKIENYEQLRKTIEEGKKKIKEREKVKIYEIEQHLRKNRILKNQIEENTRKARSIVIAQKVEQNRKRRKERVQNEKVYSFRLDEDFQQKQERRKAVNKQEQAQKMKTSRYFQEKIKDTLQSKSLNTDQIMNKAVEKEKQLEKLSKMEEQLAKRNSQSIMISNQMKKKFLDVLGTKRESTKLPKMRSRSKTGLSGYQNSPYLS